MFKDKETINRRNMVEYGENLRLLADVIRGNEKQREKLKEFLLEKDRKEENKSHHPEHKICSGCKKEKDKKMRITEKRLCRCMYYFNHTPHTTEQKSECDKCDFPVNRKNIGDYEILDYEVPMDKKWDKVGGVDLILKGKNNDVYYGVEVKPAYSNETLVRMAAEILTYGEINHYRGNIAGNQRISYKPGICFFKDSTQHKDYCKFTDISKFSKKVLNAQDIVDDFEKILSYINVFMIKCDDKSFKIELIRPAYKELATL